MKNRKEIERIIDLIKSNVNKLGINYEVIEVDFNFAILRVVLYSLYFFSIFLFILILFLREKISREANIKKQKDLESESTIPYGLKTVEPVETVEFTQGYTLDNLDNNEKPYDFSGFSGFSVLYEDTLQEDNNEQTEN